MIYDEVYPNGAPHTVNPLSGWYYADSNNKYPIIDGSICYIACPNGTFIRVEDFCGEYDDFHPDCFQNYKNGIYVLIGLWNTQGTNATLPEDKDSLEDLRILGINFLLGKNSDLNNEFLKYPLKLTSGTEKKYIELPPSKFNRWDAGQFDYLDRIINIHSALSECYHRISLGDKGRNKCKTCYCHFLGLDGDCKNSEFLDGVIALHKEQNFLDNFYDTGMYE